MRMTTPNLRIVGVLLALGLGLLVMAPAELRAQTSAMGGREPSSIPATAGYANPIPASGAAYASAYANPFVNPSFNPYLNPYMTVVPTDPELGLLYLLGAQSARGGLGSGQLSGTRGPQAASDRPVSTSPPSPITSPQTRPRTTTTRGPARLPGSPMVPTVGAESYFQRLPDRGGAAADYFGRSVRRVPQP